MKIDEEKIREAAEGEADERLKEDCVRTYCEVLDMIRLVEVDPYRVGLVSAHLRGNVGQMAEKYLPKLWARWEELQAAAWRKVEEETAKLPWWKRWLWR